MVIPKRLFAGGMFLPTPILSNILNNTIMKHSTKTSSVIFCICLLMAGVSSFANDGRNQLPVYKRFVMTGESAMKVDLKWVAGSETLGLFIDNPEGKPISVTVRDASGSVIENLVFPKNQKKLFKYYNFAEAEEGNYSLEISDKTATISKKINLKRIESKTTTILSVL
jgi:hypothetical protein